MNFDFSTRPGWTSVVTYDFMYVMYMLFTLNRLSTIITEEHELFYGISWTTLDGLQYYT